MTGIRSSIGILLAVLAMTAFPAEAALCGSDFWGGRSSAIDILGDRAVTITAVTNLNHISSHTSCEGSFYAKVKLVGEQASCEGTSTKSHSWSGEGTGATVQRNCTGLAYHVQYSAQGFHGGFGEAEHTTWSPYALRFVPPEEEDNDMDSYNEVQGDCNDTDGSIYPGANPDCQNTNVDKNCNGIEDITECGGSPILVDVDGQGFRLTSASAGVTFDFYGTGEPIRLAWTAAGSDDAWLCVDRNGNGAVDGGHELFGNMTPQPPSAAPHGFLALAQFDSPAHGGNSDGIIDARDAVFSALRLWQDRNHDGISQNEELIPLHAAGVKGLALEFHEAQRRDPNGNVFRYRAKVVRVAPHAPGPWAYDVYLKIQP